MLNGQASGFVFFRGGLPEKGAQFFLGRCDMVVILLSFLCNYENLTLKLPQGKRCYPDEGSLFIGRFKVESVSWMSVTLEASKRVSKPVMRMMQGH